MQSSNKVLPREETMVGFARSNTWRVIGDGEHILGIAHFCTVVAGCSGISCVAPWAAVMQSQSVLTLDLDNSKTD